DCFKAATRLAHSGAFGLIVIDLSQDAQSFVHRALTALLSRLVGLSQTHDLAVVILTTKSPEEASLDSLISLRGEARRGESLGGGRFSGQLEITKDKRRGPYWKHRNQYLGPPGIW
ncbi:MAG: recombinase A, partial [Deltaproteobacteria bacterium CG17_big_fil_post_rev_8_21_14_2_50_63_7]